LRNNVFLNRFDLFQYLSNPRDTSLVFF
jgi:hypothetical protein